MQTLAPSKPLQASVPCTTTTHTSLRAGLRRSATRQQRCVRAQASDLQTTSLSSKQLADEWASFADSISGEWNGKSASFTRTGELKPLPQQYVPPEYGNWGIVLSDWSTLTSVDVQGDVCSITTKHMFPTVGCEADAASFTELVETGAAPGSGAEAGCPLFVSGGSYSLGPTHIPSGARSFNIESCFFLNKEQRVRMRVKLDRYLDTKPYTVQEVELVSETLEGAYKGGRELPMCCGAEAGFSGQDRLDAVVPDRSWAPAAGLVYDTSAASVAARSANAEDVWVTDQTAAVCLPLNAWVRLNIGDEAFEVEMGVVHPETADTASIVRRLYTAGALESVLIADARAA